MSKKSIYLILIISAVFSVIPFSAHAGIPILEDIMNGLDMIYQAVEEVVLPLITFFIKTYILFAISFFALIMSASLFGMFVDNPNWFNLNSQVIQGGWSFSVGLANMFIILFLIFIAIQFILKIDTLATKKALINLIIVAILLNFSLLFVRMIVDIPVFAFNTFQNAAGVEGISEFMNKVVAPLTGAMGTILIAWGAIIAGLALLFIAPVIGPFAQLAFAVTFPMILPIFGVIFLFIIAAFLLAGIFFTYVFLFGARGVIIVICAILAPLAFLCLIFSQTKKYWSMWLKILLEWSLLGIVFLFFLVLGFKGLGAFSPALNPTNIEGSGFWTDLLAKIKGWFIYYFCLFVYLLLVSIISKRLMPTFAEGLISGAKEMGGMMWTKGLKPAGRALRDDYQRLAAHSPRIQGLGQRMAQWEGPRGRFGRGLAETFMVPQVLRATGRAIGTGAIEAERKNIDEAEKKFAGQRVEAQIDAWVGARTDETRIGILNAITKDKNIDTAMDAVRFGNAAVPLAEVERLYPIAQNRYDQHGTLRGAFPDIAARNLPPQPPGAPAPPPPPPGISLAQQNAQQVFDRIKISDYDNMSRTVLTNPEFLEAILRRGTGTHIGAFISKWGTDGSNALETRIRELAAVQNRILPRNVTPQQMRDWLQNENPRLYRYLRRGATGPGSINI